MSYYTHSSGKPVAETRGLSAEVRAELDLIATSFATLPASGLLFSGNASYGVDTGAVNAFVVAVNVAVTGYTDGMTVLFKAANSNTAASTININGIGSAAITRADGSALQANDLVAGQIAQTSYNATTGQFQINITASAIAAAASAAAAAASAAAAAASAVTATTAAMGLIGTSTTSLTIGTGAKVFTTQSGKQFATGQFFLAVSAANSANYFHGRIDSYVGTTLTTTVTAIGGSGTFADWNISISGAQGPGGPTSATRQTLTDAATIAWDTSLGNIGVVTLGGNRTIALPTNMAVGVYGLEVKQDATGSRLLTFNAVFKWSATTPPVLSTAANALDYISLFWNGTIFIGSYLRGVG